MATNAGSADASTIETPARIEMIKQLLTSMGVDDHDPKVGASSPLLPHAEEDGGLLI